MRAAGPINAPSPFAPCDNRPCPCRSLLLRRWGALLLLGSLSGSAGEPGRGLADPVPRGVWRRFSWQNTLLRAAPLMLTALAVALPAQAGLMVIGGEARVAGRSGVRACPGHLFGPPANTVGSMMVLLAGAPLAGQPGCGWRLAGCGSGGVNETISSLLLAYIAIALFKHFVEGRCATRRA